jgi:hypothetical protein
MLKFVANLFMKPRAPTPPPDVAQLPALAGQSAVRVVLSPAGSPAAVIARDEQEIYRVRVYWWDTSDWKEWRAAYWARHDAGSLIDTMPAAYAVAEEALIQYARRDDMAG